MVDVWLTRDHDDLIRMAVPLMRHNYGSSLGLQYPLIFNDDEVWCRYCGLTFYLGPDAAREAYRLNGHSPWPDASTLAEIDATP